MSDKIEVQKQYLLEHPIDAAEADRRMQNVPSGPLLDRWTHETLDCPACNFKALDKYTGGPNVEQGEISRTESIYHCRVCDLNLTEEEYKDGDNGPSDRTS